jgi:hypothetical protein
LISTIGADIRNGSQTPLLPLFAVRFFRIWERSRGFVLPSCVRCVRYLACYVRKSFVIVDVVTTKRAPLFVTDFSQLTNKFLWVIMTRLPTGKLSTYD